MEYIIKSIATTYEAYKALDVDPNTPRFKVTLALNLLDSAMVEGTISHKEYNEICKILRNSNNKE